MLSWTSKRGASEEKAAKIDHQRSLKRLSVPTPSVMLYC